MQRKERENMRSERSGEVRSHSSKWAMIWNLDFVLGWMGGSDESAGPCIIQWKVWKVFKMELDSPGWKL